MTPVGVFFCWQGGAERDFVNSTIYCTVLTAQSQDYRIIPIQSRTQAHGVICTKSAHPRSSFMRSR